MVEAKRKWNSCAKENARRYILGSEVDEDDFGRSGRLEMIELLRDLPPNIGNWIVLDIGCGIGRLEEVLSDKFKEVHGVDVSGEMINTITRQINLKVTKAGPNPLSGAPAAEEKTEEKKAE